MCGCSDTPLEEEKKKSELEMNIYVSSLTKKFNNDKEE